MQYLARFERDGDGWLVTFPSLPEAITGGADIAAARANAIDALEVVLLTYAKDGREIPPADKQRKSKAHEVVSPSASVVAKLGFIDTFRKSGLTRVGLAKRLGKAEGEIRRMLDPYHATKLPTLEDAMKVLGKCYVVLVEEMA